MLGFSKLIPTGTIVAAVPDREAVNTPIGVEFRDVALGAVYP